MKSDHLAPVKYLDPLFPVLCQRIVKSTEQFDDFALTHHNHIDMSDCAPCTDIAPSVNPAGYLGYNLPFRGRIAFPNFSKLTPLDPFLAQHRPTQTLRGSLLAHSTILTNAYGGDPSVRQCSYVGFHVSPHGERQHIGLVMVYHADSPIDLSKQPSVNIKGVIHAMTCRSRFTYLEFCEEVIFEFNRHVQYNSHRMIGGDMKATYSGPMILARKNMDRLRPVELFPQVTDWYRNSGLEAILR